MLLPTAHCTPSRAKRVSWRGSPLENPSGTCLSGALPRHLSKISAQLVLVLVLEWISAWPPAELAGFIYRPCWMKSTLLKLHAARCSYHVRHVRGKATWAKSVGGDTLMEGQTEVLVLFKCSCSFSSRFLLPSLDPNHKELNYDKETCVTFSQSQVNSWISIIKLKYMY